MRILLIVRGPVSRALFEALNIFFMWAIGPDLVPDPHYGVMVGYCTYVVFL
jgi:hypothetical protein